MRSGHLYLRACVAALVACGCAGAEQPKEDGVADEQTIDEAIDAQDLRQVARLIETDPSAVHRMPSEEWGDRTPLHHAANKGLIEISELLLKKGADPNAVSDEEGWTPLHLAGEGGHPEIVRLLLDHGANIEARTAFGKCTPLLRAALMGGSGSSEAMQVLIERGANLHARDAEGLDAFQLAALGWNRDAVEVLLEHGFELDLRSAMVLSRPDDIRRALRGDPHAVQNTPKPERLIGEAVRMVENILEAQGGLSHSRTNTDREMRIAKRVVPKHLDILELLLEQGAQIENQFGSSSLSRALQWPDPAMAEFLLAHGAPLADAANSSFAMWFAAQMNLYCSKDMLMLLQRYEEPPASIVNPPPNPAVAVLIKDLNAEDPVTRSIAAMSLAMYGPLAKEAVPALRRALADEHPSVREAAEQAIKTIERKEK